MKIIQMFRGGGGGGWWVVAAVVGGGGGGGGCLAVGSTLGVPATDKAEGGSITQVFYAY